MRLTVTNEAKRNEDTVEPLVRHHLSRGWTENHVETITCSCGQGIVRGEDETPFDWFHAMRMFQKDHVTPNASLDRPAASAGTVGGVVGQTGSKGGGQ